MRLGFESGKLILDLLLLTYSVLSGSSSMFRLLQQNQILLSSLGQVIGYTDSHTAPSDDQSQPCPSTSSPGPCDWPWEEGDFNPFQSISIQLKMCGVVVWLLRSRKYCEENWPCAQFGHDIPQEGNATLHWEQTDWINVVSTTFFYVLWRGLLSGKVKYLKMYLQQSFGLPSRVLIKPSPA